ncbi:MAG: site-specific integrase [Proteobacteria bacterium]|nr:site-specific integrase [Pseudomonadota bacterium]MBU4354420.1 site-specific integrase [Pseudomonadota bacterium]MBU4447969.1 site-specific integrase [Pseudomonadota bacterium]MCG2772579.1 site-specific integrase [Desulfobacterales bacterium]
MKRHKTTYPGIFYREADRIGGKGLERVYYIVFKQGGKVFEEKVGRQFKDDMTPARAARIRAERIDGKRQSRQEIREAAKQIWTVDRLWQEYIEPKPKSTGFKTDFYRYQKFLQTPFGGKEPKAIAQIDTHRLRITLAKTLAPKTVKNVLELLERIINFGMKKGLSPGLGFKIEMPRVNNLKTEDLTPEQLVDLLSAIDEDHDIQAANLMKMALVTGMRRGELLKLQWADIDVEKGFIHIRHDPKGGKDQTIPLNQAAREVLEHHPKSDSPFVFPGRGGKQRTGINAPVNRIKSRAGLPKDFRPLHGLRHTYASMLASSGQVDLYTLGKLLTHKSAAMTMRYAHLRDETLRRASDLASDLIGQAMNGRTLHVVNMEKEKKAH